MELWAARVGRPLTEGEEAALMALLPAARRERLAGVRERAPRQGPLCAYGLLRLALRERQALPSAVLPPMALGDRGKPWFPDCPEVQFSLSHTDGAVLVGVSETPIGVDIERLRDVPRRLAARLGADGPPAFFREWTRREAWAKRSGEGLPALLEQAPLGEEGLWTVDVFPGYAAAVCGEPGDPPGEARICALEDLIIWNEE